jgi:two-component system phosphate regulon response regulator PhoB
MDTILVVEDEHDIMDLVAYNLSKAGFAVLKATDGLEALDKARRILPALIILDLLIPTLDGTEVCKRLKRDPATQHIPIIMLTAKREEIDRILGFELGADDYVTKPFSPRELLLRVKAVLKRLEPNAPIAPVWQIEGLRIDVPRHIVFVDEEPVHLTATEFSLLQYLVERRGRVQTRELLLQNVWQYHDDIDSRTVDTHIRRLRSKLGRFGAWIETVPRIGYRFRGAS